MVKFALASIALMAVSLPFSLADNCTPGIRYCGYNLLAKGDYLEQITEALSGANQPTDSQHVRQSFFVCTGGPGGEISFQRYCDNTCHDGGSGKNDWCN
ncbi:uncharacterized protein PGRI_004520 [Penicillium griseofulvum]|uniref:Uncharacterized protein n=1 Tax=Penicillium patulum TaxID=5078 RepID=A0A135LWQ9_PENPA|nr:uncharacterized protein PGRI_004520 [Penicillium griseofulvum]KXG53402.1 hypothetical protein PGRI_004520 [Penicillium griseofulvum]